MSFSIRIFWKYPVNFLHFHKKTNRSFKPWKKYFKTSTFTIFVLSSGLSFFQFFILKFLSFLLSILSLFLSIFYSILDLFSYEFEHIFDIDISFGTDFEKLQTFFFGKFLSFLIWDFALLFRKITFRTY